MEKMDLRCDLEDTSSPSPSPKLVKKKQSFKRRSECPKLTPISLKRRNSPVREIVAQSHDVKSENFPEPHIWVPHQTSTDAIQPIEVEETKHQYSTADSFPVAGPSHFVSTNDIKVNNRSDLNRGFGDEFDEINGLPSNVYKRDISYDDKLDPHLCEAIAQMQRTMDAEQSRLLCVSGSFNWSEDFSTFKGQREEFRGPTPGPTEVFDTCTQAFMAIWDKTFMATIAEHTNKYAKQVIDESKAKGELKPKSRLNVWHDTSAQELYIFFALQMAMGLDIRTKLNEYWKTNSILEMPNFRRVMSFNRYILLNKFLYFVDNTDTSQSCLRNEDCVLSGKLFKLAPVIHQLNAKFQALYNLGAHISIDESLTLFKGRQSWIQAMRSKIKRDQEIKNVGIRSFQVCESDTGYLYKFCIYTGKNDTESQSVTQTANLDGKSTKVVLDLLKGLENRGHLVTMDSLYNSPALSRYLKSKGFDCLGTLSANRKHVPEAISKMRSDVAKGTIVARHSGDLSVFAWKDIRMVNLISTYHDASTYTCRKSGEVMVAPVSVRDYNKTMAGVDMKDRKLSMFLMERTKDVKWYHKMYKRLMNASVLNAFILCRSSWSARNKPVMTHRQFRFKLADELISLNITSSLADLVVDPVDDDIRLRKDIAHLPRYTSGGKRRRCAVCSKEKQKRVVSECVTCDKGLCFERCWEIYHSITDLKA